MLLLFDFDQNCFQNYIDTLVHIFIRKSKNLDAFGSDKSFFFFVVSYLFVSIVCYPIKLNGKRCMRAVKINNVFPDSMLTTKFIPKKLFSF